MVAELLAPAAIPPLLIHRAELKWLLHAATHVQLLLAQAAALKVVVALCAALQFLTSSRA
jgi:hypothetical protein